MLLNRFLSFAPIHFLMEEVLRGTRRCHIAAGSMSWDVPFGRAVEFMRQLPVSVLASAEDVHNFRVSPTEVEVTVQSDPRTLQNLESKDIRPMVDLTGVGVARDLRKRIEVSVPAGVTPMRVIPEQVQVIFPPER